jgi:parallel beta-helix repeat protein
MKIKLKFLEILFVSFCLILVSSSAMIGSQINNQETNGLIVLLSPDVIIPDDYNTIQEGINNANLGYTIFVKNGIYYENIVIDKKITLVGENKYNTTINGILNSESTITVNSPNIIIKNFSIINGLGENTFWDNSGVFITSSNVTIENNLIMHNTLGICALDTAHNLTIYNNDFVDDSILLGNYEHTTNSFIIESFLHKIENNTVNGKPLYYFKNTNDFIVPNDAGQIILSNCSNVTIKDTFFANVDFPILVNFCNNCLIENNTIENTYGELILLHSDNCTINNNYANNVIYGVCLDYKSTNNAVFNNLVENSIGGVVVMTSSSNNRVYKNKVYDNTYGIAITNKSSYNLVYENDIQRNSYGIRLFLDPYNNSIENNSLQNNIFSVISIGMSKNYWNQNHWNRPRILPKFIFAYKQIGFVPVPYCITGVDWHPLREKPV